VRCPEYLSPTSVDLFFKDRTEFYLRYMADKRPPRIPQTKPMSVGSAFDAYVKAYIDKMLFGGRPEFEFEALFEAQVEAHNRDWAREAGEHAFECYKASGALADLMIELGHATHEPRLESTVRDTVVIVGPTGEKVEITLLGKPDLYFIIGDAHLLNDWKVNGFCGKRATSPKPHYIMVRGDWGRGNGNPHKDAQLMTISNINVNVATTLEQIYESWARQLYIYARVLGEDSGSKFIAGIEQLACKPTAEKDKPNIRVASFRSRISAEYQKKIDEQLIIVWTAVKTGHIFIEMSEEENKARCEQLDNYHEAFEGDEDDPKKKRHNEWFREITREPSNF